MPRTVQESIVEYFSGHEGYKCGYCKSATTNFSHGMWAHSLKPVDYESLLNRGWRRSGSYLYKPTNHLTCCPMYTIDCKAIEFNPSKSQRKVLRKFNQYLCSGELRSVNKYEKQQVSAMDEGISGVGYREGVAKNVSMTVDDLEGNPAAETFGSLSKQFPAKAEPQLQSSATGDYTQTLNRESLCDSESTTSGAATTITTSSYSARKKGRKARDIRIERKKLKLIARGIDPSTVFQPRKPQQAKTLEELTQDLSEPKVKLQIKLLKTDTPEFQTLISIEHEVYQKYQMSIHKDAEEECTLKQYKRFLCDNPLNIATNDFTGAYHQQYYLDGKLIAVGVLDILPTCVSSVYFFYDPDFMGLSLGTFAALREIAFVRNLSKVNPNMRNYYMGFYIHSCIKMRYKGSYTPSYLLCPETYTWKLLDETLRNRLTLQKYCRLSDSLDDPVQHENSIHRKVHVLHRRTIMPYPIYELKCGDSEREEVTEYCNLVGEAVAAKLILYRA